MNPNFAARLVARLWPEGDSVTGSQVFAVVDGAQDPRIWPLIRFSGLEYLCLFAGNLAPALQMAAPYLVRLSPTASLTHRLFEIGWQGNWSVLACTASDVTLQFLHRHLRTLLRVQDGAGHMLMFRFYDPRILRVYLPTCTAGEAVSLFGPIDRFLCASDGDEPAVTFSRTASTVDAERAATRRSGLKDRSATLMVRAMQFEAFEANLRRRVKARVLADCRACPPGDVALPSDAVLAALLDQCEASIDRYDGDFMLDAPRHLLLMIEFGPDFEQEAWARTVFEDPDIPGTSKLDVLDVHAAMQREHAEPCR